MLRLLNTDESLEFNRGFVKACRFFEEMYAAMERSTEEEEEMELEAVNEW